MTRSSLPCSSPPVAGFFIFIILATFITSVKAATDNNDERLYQIELIIFENKGTTGSSEVWPDDPGLPELKGGRQLHHPKPIRSPSGDAITTTEQVLTEGEDTNTLNGVTVTPTPNASRIAAELPEKESIEPYTLLPNELLNLNKDLDSLYNSREFQPLLHIGWQQYVPERTNSEKIQLDSRELLLHTVRIQDKEEEEINPADIEPGSDSTAPEPKSRIFDQGPDEIVTEINENFITGTLTISRGRYLHLDLDLLYQRQSNSPQLFSFFGFSNSSDTPEKYRMQQIRRMKRDEINYFDHPKFGVLAIITAVEDNNIDTRAVQTIPLKRRN